ncbi:MAG: hypothetical protein DCE90_02570 [Pseudanabaena sp.]|nr:MAG: hypothetical protein DCE90_02570 [Pseudanabaena sp.]
MKGAENHKLWRECSAPTVTFILLSYCIVQSNEKSNKMTIKEKVLNAVIELPQNVDCIIVGHIFNLTLSLSSRKTSSALLTHTTLGQFMSEGIGFIEL